MDGLSCNAKPALIVPQQDKWLTTSKAAEQSSGLTKEVFLLSRVICKLLGPLHMRFTLYMSRIVSNTGKEADHEENYSHDSNVS